MSEWRSGNNPYDTQYTYDNFGNRSTKVDSSGTTTYTYDVANELTTALRAVEAVTGDSTVIGAQYGTDASNFSHAGIPSVVLGPGSIAQAHTAVEYVDIDQVEKAVLIYERLCLQQ